VHKAVTALHGGISHLYRPFGITGSFSVLGFAEGTSGQNDKRQDKPLYSHRFSLLGIWFMIPVFKITLIRQQQGYKNCLKKGGKLPVEDMWHSAGPGSLWIDKSTDLLSDGLTDYLCKTGGRMQGA